MREEVPEKEKAVDNLTIMMSNPKAEEIFQDALTLESGLFLARDIGKLRSINQLIFCINKKLYLFDIKKNIILRFCKVLVIRSE